MRPINEQLQELSALLQVHLINNYDKGTWFTTDQETHAYFKQLATAKKTPPPPAVKPQNLIVEPIKPPIVEKSSTQPIKGAAQEIKTVSQLSALVLPSVTNTSVVINSPSQPDELPAKASDRAPLQDSSTAQKLIEAVKSTANAKTINREAFVPSSGQDLSDLCKIFAEKLPQIEIIDTVPSDDEAKKIALAWKKNAIIPEVIILSFNDQPKEKSFLANLAAAMDQCLAPAKILSAVKMEQDNGWDKLLQSQQLRLIVASNYGIYSLPELMKRYREDSKGGRHYFNHVRLHLLSDISLYMQEPHLKASLWRTLNEILGSK